MSGIERFFSRLFHPNPPPPVEPPAPEPVPEPSPAPAPNDYTSRYAQALIRSEYLGEVSSTAGRILTFKDQYDKVEGAIGVPWYVVGIIHSLEANLNFACHLHNGDPLTARTVHVPSGRPITGNPPFAWYESAIDALTIQKPPSVWTLDSTLNFLEGYNGFGYKFYHPSVLSPYLWSMTTLYTKGKYGADGLFDPELVSQQVGAVAILKVFQQQNLIKLA